MFRLGISARCVPARWAGRLRRCVAGVYSSRNGRSAAANPIPRLRAVARPKVRFQETPNPNAGKFTVGRTLVEGRRGRTFATRQDAEGDPLAARLFAEPGVVSVFVVADFVTVTKDADASWAELAPRVQAALRDVL
jgi:hypothetical protein